MSTIINIVVLILFIIIMSSINSITSSLQRSNTDPDVGGTQPVDCGGISSYGPFGMLTSMGAHAAMEMKRADDPSNPHRGYTKIVAKWVPPSNWENIIYRKMITIQ